MATAYDSTADTNKHRDFVRMLMYSVAKDIMDRADHHDDSKLLLPRRNCLTSTHRSSKTAPMGLLRITSSCQV